MRQKLILTRDDIYPGHYGVIVGIDKDSYTVGRYSTREKAIEAMLKDERKNTWSFYKYYLDGVEIRERTVCDFLS